MSVLSTINDFLHRHRKKIVVGSVIITGSILLTRYAQQKLRQWQEKEAKEFMDRTRKQQHFESTERTCNQTILNLVTTLNESVSNVLNTESIIAELRNNPTNKVEMWEELKILVFTRASCVIYVCVMLVVTLRLQLNMLGGYLYKDSNFVSMDVQEKFLSLCHTLLDSGVREISDVIQKEVVKIVGLFPLQKQLKLDNLEKIFWAVQAALRNSNEDPIKKFRHYTITPNVVNDNKIYNSMVRDTADLLDSDEVKNLAYSCVSRGFVLLGDQISEFYGPNLRKMDIASSSDTNNFIHPSQIQIAIAKLIPIINGLCSKNSLPDLFVRQLLSNDKLKTLGANVYESFSYNSV